MQTYEVFRRSGHKSPFEHCGAVIAPDHEMALLLAKEQFLRRREGEHLWVVRRSDIHSFKDEGLLEIAADKSYRFASAYRDVVKKRDRARLRAGPGGGVGQPVSETGRAGFPHIRRAESPKGNPLGEEKNEASR